MTWFVCENAYRNSCEQVRDRYRCKLHKHGPDSLCEDDRNCVELTDEEAMLYKLCGGRTE